MTSKWTHQLEVKEFPRPLNISAPLLVITCSSVHLGRHYNISVIIPITYQCSYHMGPRENSLLLTPNYHSLDREATRTAQLCSTSMGPVAASKELLSAPICLQPQRKGPEKQSRLQQQPSSVLLAVDARGGAHVQRSSVIAADWPECLTAHSPPRKRLSENCFFCFAVDFPA